MKRIYIVVLLMMVFVCSGCQTKETLVLYLPGEYIDNSSLDGENLIKKFKEEYNCNVKMINFTSNEIAVSMMETNSFDLVIPSDYAIEQLAKEDKLIELDWDKVIDYSKDDIATSLKEILPRFNDGGDDFDLLQYSVPYFWGSVGICYNPSNVSIEDLDYYGWNIFKQEKYRNRVAYYDSSRDGYVPALKALGYSINTTNKDEVKQATDWLREMKKNVNPKFKTDELLSELPDMRYDLALIYSGDALYCIELALENDEILDFYMPKQGTNFFCDGMVIPKNAKNPELAYKFISFMSQPENALANTYYVGYTASVGEAFEEAVTNEDYYGGYPEIYNPQFRNTDEFFRFNLEMKYFISDEWCKFIA